MILVVKVLKLRYGSNASIKTEIRAHLLNVVPFMLDETTPKHKKRAQHNPNLSEIHPSNQDPVRIYQQIP